MQSATELRLVASIDQPTNLCVSGRGMYGRDVVDPPGRSLPQTSSSRGPGDRAGMWVVCRTTSSDCTSGLTASSGRRLKWRFYFGSWQAGSSARMCRRVEASQPRTTVDTHGSPSRQRIWGIGTPARTTQASGEDGGQCSAPHCSSMTYEVQLDRSRTNFGVKSAVVEMAPAAGGE